MTLRLEINAISEPSMFDTAQNGFSYQLSINVRFIIAIYFNQRKRHEKYIASAKKRCISG
jgi:hypothetical protein